jgi:hypothetical protein
MRYRDVPEDWIKRFRASDFDYRLRGRVAGGSPVEWSGTRRWDQVEVEKREEVASGFVKLTSIQLTEFSLLEFLPTHAAGGGKRAIQKCRIPASFPSPATRFAKAPRGNSRRCHYCGHDRI